MKLLLGLAAILMMASCTKENVSTTGTNLPVIAGYLLPGNIVTVKLYHQKVLTDTAQFGAPITGQKLYISDGTNNVLLNETAAGTYTYSDKTFLVTGKTYTLQFNYLNYAVSAKTVMPTKPLNFAVQKSTIYIAQTSVNTTLDTLDTFTWTNPDSLNHVLVFNNGDGTSFPLNSFGGSRPANFESNTNQASNFVLTQRTFAYYGDYQVVLLRVNAEYINLIKSNTSNSTSQNLSNTPTNVVNGFGIFTAMQADTLSLNVFN